jgi:polyhydroxybutyrate depolymerase
MRNLQWIGVCLFAGTLGAAGCSAEVPATTPGSEQSNSGAASGSGASTSGGGGSVSNGGSLGGQTAGGASGTSGNHAAGSGGAAAGSGTFGGGGVGGAAAAGVGSGGSTAGGDATGGGATAGSGASSGAQASGGVPGDAGSAGASGGSSVSCPSGGWTPGDHAVTLMHGGIERVYEVHVPPDYTGATPVPLVLTIHGAHNTIAMVRGWSQMNPVADANGFIVAYPQALDCWNSGFVLPGCSAADDDVGFLTSVVEDIGNHACIDPKRVYATGISNGAMMAQKLGCDEADVFAAVGGVAGPNGGGCDPSRAISVVYMHGTEDGTVGYSSAQPTVDGWATGNGCSSSPVETYAMGSTRCETYEGCDDGVEVVFCTVTGMGHCWPEDTRCGPGGGPDFGVDDFEASPFMWEFFQRHPLP